MDTAGIPLCTRIDGGTALKAQTQCYGPSFLLRILKRGKTKKKKQAQLCFS